MISCVVTVRNRPEYLRACVKSLVDQTYSRPYEIIIVDDGSDDGQTRGVCRELSREQGGVFVNTAFFPKRRGPGAARNRGNEMARGKIIVVCDSDDISLPNRLASIADFFAAHPNRDIFYSGANWVTEDLKHKAYHHARRSDVRLLDHGRQEIWHPTMAYKASVAREIEYPEEMADVDLGFLMAARAAGKSFGCLDTPLVMYRSHGGQISRADYELQQKLANDKRKGLKA